MREVPMSLAITAIVALVLLLLTFVGSQRDLRRGALTFAATLFGAALIDLWTERWSADLAILLRTDPQGALFTVQVVLLLLSAGLLGYGGGVLLSPTPLPPNWRRRIIGGIIGFLNALMLVGYFLRFGVRSGAGFAAFVEENLVLSVLHDQLPMFFGIIALFGAGAVLVQLGLNAFRGQQRKPGLPTGRAPATPPIGQRSDPTAEERRLNQLKVLEKLNQANEETRQK
jgi:hypothetical protein